jgi:hypothetical protein
MTRASSRSVRSTIGVTTLLSFKSNAKKQTSEGESALHAPSNDAWASGLNMPHLEKTHRISPSSRASAVTCVEMLSLGHKTVLLHQLSMEITTNTRGTSRNTHGKIHARPEIVVKRHPRHSNESTSFFQCSGLPDPMTKRQASGVSATAIQLV